MNKHNTKKEYITRILKSSKFAVLATEGDGQPHTSLIAITPFGSYRKLIFATYRNTLKYRNLVHNSKVAVLIEGGYAKSKDLEKSIVLTIIGHSEEISIEENEAAFNTHLKRHPEMESFMRSPDCALIMVIARSFQVVSGINDIKWISADNLDSAG